MKIDMGAVCQHISARFNLLNVAALVTLYEQWIEKKEIGDVGSSVMARVRHV